MGQLPGLSSARGHSAPTRGCGERIPGLAPREQSSRPTRDDSAVHRRLAAGSIRPDGRRALTSQTPSVTSPAAMAPMAPAIPQSSASRRESGDGDTIGGRIEGTSSGIKSIVVFHASGPDRGTTSASPVRICSSVLATSFCKSSCEGSLWPGRLLAVK